jgi:hypothetical protein
MYIAFLNQIERKNQAQRFTAVPLFLSFFLNNSMHYLFSLLFQIERLHDLQERNTQGKKKSINE